MITLNNINKYFYHYKKNEMHIINNTSIELPDKGLIALLGPSGSGKTTLLNVIGGLDKFYNGTINILGNKITSNKFKKMDKIRNNHIGYIFQDYKLIDDLSVYDNVALSLKMCGLKNKKMIKEKVDYVLDILDLYRYRRRPASMLSGGERQRVGIARAIVKNPDIVICDEPTGNLDSRNSIEIMNIIKSISKNRLVILVTHETDLAKFYADRILEIKDGKIENDYVNESIEDLDYQMDNKIYLKDFKYHDELKDEKININFYSDKDSKIKVNIVVRNNNIFIETNKKDNIEIVNEDSTYELINDHYKKLDKSIYEKYEFNINDNFTKKYKSIYNLISMIKLGFNKIKTYNLIKKLMIACFGISGGFIIFSIASIFGVMDYQKKDFQTNQESYVAIDTNNKSYEVYEELNKNENVNYILPGNGKVNLLLKNNYFYQNRDYVTYLKEASLASKSLLTKDKIVYGELTENENEIVIDSLVYEKTKVDEIFMGLVGINDASDLVGKKIVLSNDKEYTITGVVEEESPSIYFTDSEFVYVFSYADNANNYVESGLNIELVDAKMDEIKLKRGKLPQNNYEVIVPYSMRYEISLNKEINTKINGNKLKVVGYYESDKVSTYLVNKDTLYASLIDNASSLVISAKDKDKLIDEYKEQYLARDLYSYEEEVYLKEKEEAIKSKIRISLILLGVTLAEIYFMIRSSFMSRVKEVGILRAIGVKKNDIYKMFAGEIIVTTTIGGLIGILLVSGLLDAINEFSNLTGTHYLINPFVIGLSVLILYVFNIIVGLLPVFNTVRKTPAQILSRKDI